MSILDRINKKLKSFINNGHKEEDDKKNKTDENNQCPVCGYYCKGNGGHGCIDKPSMVQVGEPKGKVVENLYICPIADECELDWKDECTHKVPHEWNFNCPNELTTNEGTEIENDKCPIGGCVPIPKVDKSNTDIAKELEEKLREIDEKPVLIVEDKPKNISLRELIKQKRGTPERLVPRNSQVMEEAVKQVVDDLIALPDDEFKKEIEEAKRELEQCQPDTCHGECQGEGWCEIATQWRERIHPTPKIQPSFVSFKKKIKRKKEKAEFWEEKRKKRKKKKDKHKRKLKRR